MENEFDITDVEMSFWNIRNESKKLTESLNSTIDLIENPNTIIEVKDSNKNIVIEGKTIHLLSQIKLIKTELSRINYLLNELEDGIKTLKKDSYTIEDYTEQFDDEYENIIEYYIKQN